jgi:hypothetical protein
MVHFEKLSFAHLWYLMESQAQMFDPVAGAEE